MSFLDEILRDVRDELAAAKAQCPLAEIRRMLADAPEVRSLPAALGNGFRLIAEVKERSPSVGPMRAANVAAALPAYQASPQVAAISVLTNKVHFGMNIGRLAGARVQVTKPLLRKDFILDEYQIREARAFGADAILLMANVLDVARLSGFYNLARELGMEALFEIHTEEEIALLPPDAHVVGINSRKFRAESGFVGRSGSSQTDFSLDYTAFALADRLSATAFKVAESGLSPENIAEFAKGFSAGLVGTSLLRDERGLPACLAEFEQALTGLAEAR